MVARLDGDDLIIAVRLTPRAGREAMGGSWVDARGHRWLSASVTAPPDKGRANVALCRMIASQLGVPVSSIQVMSGETSRTKRVCIIGGAAHHAIVEELAERT